MDDVGRQYLYPDSVIKTLPLAEFWPTALQLTRALNQLHQQGRLHLAIMPASVIRDPSSGTVGLAGSGTDLSLASTVQHGLTLHETGLAYLSPEQTGRTGHPVDQRSDLYSLGATFYALLVGMPPFAVQDPMELIHAHLARQPTAPYAIDPAIPHVLSSIVLKLLEKESHRRYPSAGALLADLREASAQWMVAGTVQPFPLGERDTTHPLSIPAKLYGRRAEVATLRDAFVSACNGRRELVMVGGAPGIGKSALVNELKQEAIGRGGRFAAGKFDQLERNVPYAGLVQALSTLILQLLTEPETALASWREQIQAAIAPNGAILVDLLPELQDIVGPQAPVAVLGPVESKNRFVQVFTDFLDVFGRAGHPFVLFLDDLQWADEASLQIIQQWAAARSVCHMLIAGAYRDDEVEAAHPLALMLAKLRKTHGQLVTIHMSPLGAEEVAELLSDTLHRDEGKCLPLAKLLVRKTAGNPFFIRRLLLAFHGESLIRFAGATRTWEWDTHEIERASVSENVVELMADSIDQLPDETRHLILAGACIGYRFDTATLALVSGHALDAVLHLLQPAVDGGLLVPLKEPVTMRGESASAMQFLHDRIQQAAYKLLSEARRAMLHLTIGRHLLRSAPAGQHEARLFDIVDQLNRGDACMTDPAERRATLVFNLMAGRKAKSAAAYQAAFDYLSVAKQRLPADAWSAEAGLSFDIHRELAESAYLTGRHALAEYILGAALDHAPDDIAKVDLYGMRVLAATVAGDWAGALHWGREGLLVLGQAWPLDGLAQANDTEARAVIESIGAQRIEDLVDQPEVGDEATRACMRLLSLLGPPAYFSGSEVLTFLVARGARLSILHGPSVYSSYAYVFYGAIHDARTGEYDVGHAFGKLALALARRFDNLAEESRTLEVFGLLVQPWMERLRDSLPVMKEGHRVGVASGEFAYAAFNLCAILINELPAGLPLVDVLADVQASVDFATRHQNSTAIEISLPFRQFVRAMAGRTTAPGSFDDDEFDEARFLEDARGNETAIGHYWVTRLQAAYLFGDLGAARHAMREGAKYLPTGILSMVTSAEHTFYTALTLAASHANVPGSCQATLLDDITAASAQLDSWARYCPENFLHMKKLVEAERARIGGAPWQAMECFGQAIEAADASGFVQDAALANELAARFFLGHGQGRLADLHLRAALDGYRQWGATAKVRALDEEYAARLMPRLPPQFATKPALETALAFDALSLIKSSQAIAVETEPARLFERILQVVIELLGASSGVLLQGNTGTLHVRGRITTDSKPVFALEDTPLADCNGLPRSLIRYVARTRKPLMLDDAHVLGPFAGDAEVRKLALRSVLCIPLERNLDLIGVLYVENDTMARAFTTARIEVVKVLAAQAAISLENSVLLLERDSTERELRQLAGDLASESQRKTEFIATLAHELRNPLAPIRTGLDLMRMAGKNPESMAKIQEMMGRQLKQMVHLIDDLLDVARVDSGKVHLKLERIDLRKAIASAVEATMPMIEAAGHTLDVSLSDVPLFLDADATRLAQVVSNLLANSAKYTPHGGHITLSARATGNRIRIDIADTGVGIPAHALTEVFTMFSQVSKEIGRSQGGLGIGLSLVRSLVRMHGGEVVATSAGEGKGSTFTVMLPLADDAKPHEQVPPPSVSGMMPAHALRILLADDNVDAAEMMKALLETAGHEVELVHDGQRAVDRALVNRYDLALLDIGMPQLDGYQVAQAMRKMPAHASTFLAALTGWGTEEDRKHTSNAGFDAHLTKPAADTDILKVLGAATKKMRR